MTREGEALTKGRVSVGHGNGEMRDGKFLLWGASSGDDQPLVRPLGKRAVYPRLDARTSLIVVLLLSLGLWAAIWGVVTSFASAVLR